MIFLSDKVYRVNSKKKKDETTYKYDSECHGGMFQLKTSYSTVCLILCFIQADFLDTMAVVSDGPSTDNERESDGGVLYHFFIIFIDFDRQFYQQHTSWRWEAGHYGIPEGIIAQTDHATLWALVCQQKL